MTQSARAQEATQDSDATAVAQERIGAVRELASPPPALRTTVDISGVAERIAASVKSAPLLSDVGALGTALDRLVTQGLDELPLPGHGCTLARWRALAAVAAHSLALVKLYEGHTDALAIMAELQGPDRLAGSTWGMWAAEPPWARLAVRPVATGHVEVSGRKAWCSGAAVLSHALVTAWDTDARQCLVAVPLRQQGVQVTREGWDAVGMAATESVDVVFDGALGWPVGGPGAYVQRPGFWHGGAGIAACWYGAAVRLAEVLATRIARKPEAHAAAHLGAIDVKLAETRSLLRSTAQRIDHASSASAEREVRALRASAEDAAHTVLDRVGRALGAFPYCRDAVFARGAADLAVFIRQSHAEHDLEALGLCVARSGAGAWAL